MVTPGPSVMSNSMGRNTNVNFSSIFCKGADGRRKNNNEKHK
jgi:hypothetical protein